ncbi:MAG: 3-hydroxyacyl-CoA dehydrogenase family protein [Betaproteobacteria bacterium]|jgi:3-hydroxybutyryl-CoA dehydrogenase
MFRKVGVVGAGLMGAEIALVSALSGRSVLLNDANRDLTEKALSRLNGLLEKGVDRGFYEAGVVEDVMPRIEVAEDLDSFADRDLVIEAVFEDEAVKGDIFSRLDHITSDHTVFASNTSSISITALASHVQESRRKKFLGTHFFSPVSRMKLVEVIPALDTDVDVLESMMNFCKDIGKTPIKVKDVVGFAVNRMLHAFMIEAMRLVEEGVATPEDIDLACRLGLGHAIGPFQLMDATQISLSVQVEEILHDAYGDRFKPRPLMKQMVQAGYNGKKVGRGWYKY